MPKYKPQHARLLFIDRKIREGGYPNCTSLAAEWEVSAKTIQRDLDYMRHQLDAPIAYSASNLGYYYTEQLYQLPAIAIRERDLFGLYLADKLLAEYEGTPIYDTLCSLFEKIGDALPEKITLDPAGEQAKFTVLPGAISHSNPDVWQTVVDGLRGSQQLLLHYAAPGKPVIERLFEPYHAVRHAGDWYVVGFCHLRQALRTFSISRITAASLQERHFSIPLDFDFTKLATSRFGIHEGQHPATVTIRFSREVAGYIRERNWHQSQTVKEGDSGDLFLSLTVSTDWELQRWILSWGDSAQVLEPQSLADAIRETLQQAAARYIPESRES